MRLSIMRGIIPMYILWSSGTEQFERKSSGEDALAHGWHVADGWWIRAWMNWQKTRLCRKRIPFGGFSFHCNKNSIGRTAGKKPLQFRCSLCGTIFIQAAHRICKPGQVGGENGIRGKHITFTETVLRRNGERAHRPFFLFRKPPLYRANGEKF